MYLRTHSFSFIIRMRVSGCVRAWEGATDFLGGFTITQFPFPVHPDMFEWGPELFKHENIRLIATFFGSTQSIWGKLGFLYSAV